MGRKTNSSYRIQGLTAVGYAGRALIIVVLLSTTFGCGEKAKETAERVGKNFLEEFVAQVGIHPRSEGLGLSGSTNLQLENTIKSCYAEFVDQLASSKLRIVPAREIIRNRVYQDLLVSQSDSMTTLFKYLGDDVLTE